MSTVAIASPRVVSREEWLAARRELLSEEKAWTRRKDELSRRRRELPWVKVEKEYVFDTASGKRTLAELFDGRSQLCVKHFMFGPGWKEGCVGCSFEVDHLEGTLTHLQHHDVTCVAVARAPLAEVAPFWLRMGWRLPLVSSFGSDFNYDYGVSFTPEQLAAGKVMYNFGEVEMSMEEVSGFSIFVKGADGEVYHTNSTYGRGAEEVLATYCVLDMTPLGRNESVRGNLTDWVRHHDRYGQPGSVDTGGRYQADEKSGCQCD